MHWRGIATIVDEMIVDLGNGSAAVDYVGQTGGSAFGGFTAPADYTIVNWLTYETGGFSFTVDTKYIPEGIYDIRRSEDLPNTDANSINDNSVDARLYVGLATSYRFLEDDNRSVEVFANVRNLFDKDPPHAVSNASGRGGPVSGVGGPTNPIFYDTLGARWRAGVRMTY